MKRNQKTITKRGKIIAAITAILLACCIIVSGVMLFKSSPAVTNAANTPSTVTITSDKTELQPGDQVTLTFTFSTTRTDQWYGMQTTVLPIKSDGSVDTDLCNHLSMVSSLLPATIAAMSGDFSMPFGNYSPAVIDNFKSTGTNKGLLFMMNMGTSGFMSTSVDCVFQVTLELSSDYTGSSAFKLDFAPSTSNAIGAIPTGNANSQTIDTNTNGNYSLVGPSFQAGDPDSDPVEPSLSSFELSSTSATSGFSAVADGGTTSWKLSDHASGSKVYFRATAPTGVTVSAGSGLSSTTTSGVFSGTLAYGENKFTVTAKGTTDTKSYTHTIDLREQINTITNITASPSLTGFTFNAATSSYSITVPNSVSSLSLSVTMGGSYETLTTSGKAPTGTPSKSGKVYTVNYSLSEGTNAITVRGVSDTNVNGTGYTLNIKRESSSGSGPTQNDDSTLSGIGITSGGRPATLSPSFNPDRSDYTATVDDINDININPIPSDTSGATTDTQITNNDDGTKTVVITVTAEDGSQREYTVVVSEKTSTPAPPPAEGDAWLDRIYISEKDDGNDVLIEGFDPYTLTYNVFVPSTADHPRLTAISADPNAGIVIRVNGVDRDLNNIGKAMDNVYLSNIGDEVQVEIIVTTATDSKTYTLRIVRSSEEAYLSYLTVGNYQLYDANGKAINGKLESAVRDVKDFYVTIENADTFVSLEAHANTDQSTVRVESFENQYSVIGQFSVDEIFKGTAHADLQIAVMPKYGKVVTYMLHLTRKPAVSSNTYAGIIIDEITTDYLSVMTDKYNANSFNNEYRQYSETKNVYGTPYHIPYDVSALTVHIYFEDEGELVAPPTYQIFYGDTLKNDNGTNNEAVKLAYGVNVVIITITASDGYSSRTIAVIVYRDEPYLYQNSSVREISQFAEEYTPKVTNYSYTVANDVTKLTIYPYWDNSLYTCVVSDNATDLKVGLNMITISLFEIQNSNTGVSRTSASNDVSGAVRTITLSVFREGTGANAVWLVLFILFLVLAIIEFIVLLLLLLRNRRDGSDNLRRVVVAAPAPAPAPVVRMQPPVQYVQVPQPQVQYVQVPQPQPQPQPQPIEKPQQPVNVEVKITGCGDSDGYYKTKK